MSRTTKDKPYKVRFRNLKRLWDYERCLFYPDGHESVPCKKRKELDTEWHCMSTPAWYNRLVHTRPERRKIKVLLTVLTGRKCFGDVDVPDLGRKPHIYYW